jgi:antitoxin VapB
MGLNLKNEETHRLARELASVTGESMTLAITEALRERLDRLRGHGTSSLSTRLLEIGKDCSLHLREPFRSVEHGDLLYGENGLPE